MIRRQLILGLLFFSLSTAFCQVSLDRKNIWKKKGGAFCEIANKRQEFVKSIDILAGAVPNPDYNALKFDLVASNMLLKVVGFYTSIEAGVTSKYLTNIWGINISVFRFLYLFGGVDLFTSYGVISSMRENSTNAIRKEVGIGLYPVKNLTIRAGYSSDVGFTVTAGYRIPIKEKKKKYQPITNKKKLPANFRNLN